MTQNVNQRRSREDQRDQAEMHFVQGHLVREVSAARLDESSKLCLLQVRVPQCFGSAPIVSHPEFGQRFGIGQWAAEQPWNRVAELADERKLIAGRNPWMAGQALFRQRGPRPRKAHDEDWLRTFLPC